MTNRTNTSLIISGEKLDAGLVSSTLGIEPTEVWRQRNPILRKHPLLRAANVQWSFSLPPKDVETTDDSVKALLAELSNKLDKVKAITRCQSAKVAVQCTVRYGSQRPGYELRRESIIGIADLGATFGLDFYTEEFVLESYDADQPVEAEGQASFQVDSVCLANGPAAKHLEGFVNLGSGSLAAHSESRLFEFSFLKDGDVFCHPLFRNCHVDSLDEAVFEALELVLADANVAKRGAAGSIGIALRVRLFSGRPVYEISSGNMKRLAVLNMGLGIDVEDCSLYGVQGGGGPIRMGGI